MNRLCEKIAIHAVQEGNKMMEELQRFIEGINKLIGITISIDLVGYENLLFEKEEIDEMLIPTTIIAQLPESIVTSSVDYTDAEGNYYLYLSEQQSSLIAQVFYLSQSSIR